MLCPTLHFALLSGTSVCQLAVGLLDRHLVVIPRFQLHTQFVHVLGMLSLQLDCAVWVCTLLSCIWLVQYAILLCCSWFSYLHSGLLIWHSVCSFCTRSSQLVLYMYLLRVHLHSCWLILHVTHSFTCVVLILQSVEWLRVYCLACQVAECFFS